MHSSAALKNSSRSKRNRIIAPIKQAREAHELLTSSLERESGYVAYGGCLELFNAADPEVTISGPAGTGKTRAAMEKLHYLCRKHPRLRVLVVRKIRADLAESALQIYEDFVLDDPWRRILVGDRDRIHRRRYQYPNGSQINIGGMDKATRVLSTEYDIIYIPELIELTLEDYEVLLSRSRAENLPFNQVIGDTNPDVPTHWILQRVQAGSIRLIENDHTDNPRLWDRIRGEWTELGTRYVLGILDRLTGVRKERFRMGKWVMAEGAVYAEYDAPVHLVDTVPFDIRFYIAGVDWGYVHPGVIEIYAVGNDGQMCMVHEVYQTGRQIDWWCDKARTLQERYKVRTWWCDPAEPAYIDRFNAIPGVHAMKANNDIKPGLDAVRARLLVGETGKPRISFLRGALESRDMTREAAKKPCCLIDEIVGYVYPKGSATRGYRAQHIAELPVKEDDHSMDTMRYTVASHDGIKQGVGIVSL